MFCEENFDWNVSLPNMMTLVEKGIVRREGGGEKEEEGGREEIY